MIRLENHRGAVLLEEYNLSVIVGYSYNPFFYAPAYEDKVRYAPFYYKSRDYNNGKKLIVRHRP